MTQAIIVNEKTNKKQRLVFPIPALLLLGFVAVIPFILVEDYPFHDIFVPKSKA